MDIKVKWRTSSGQDKTLFLTLITSIWWVYLIQALFAVGENADWSFGLLIQVLIAVFLFYITMAFWINATIIRCDQSGIQLDYGPLILPFRRRSFYQRSTISKLKVEKEFSLFLDDGHRRYTTRLYIIDPENNKIRLATNLKPSVLIHLKELMEEHYNLSHST